MAQVKKYNFIAKKKPGGLTPPGYFLFFQRCEQQAEARAGDQDAYENNHVDRLSP